MPPPLSAAELAALVDRLAVPVVETDAAAALERVAVLERLKGAAAAAQARQTAAFDELRRAEQVAAGMPARQVGSGVALEVALARRESHARAARYVGWARTLVTELPATLQALQQGLTTEWRSMLVARETGWLSREHRAEVDATLGPKLADLSDRQTEAEARRLAERLDPAGKVARLRRVADERTVTIRPAPDTMTYLTALLPVAQGVAAYAALRTAADAARAAGDERTRGQVMADTLVERISGQAKARDVPITVNVVMTDQTLLRAGPGAEDPASVEDYGPIPAPIARDLVSHCGSNEDSVPSWIRRLYVEPATGQLVTMETPARLFTGTQRQFVKLRDRVCRTPYCGAPIRHIDHVVADADGGATTLHNAQGLCEACNYAKQAPGFTSRVEADGTIVISTPSGREYCSSPRPITDPGYSTRCTDTPAPSPPTTSARWPGKSIRRRPAAVETT